MVRGWIAGVLAGILVAGLGLAVASLVMGPVETGGQAPAPAPEAVPAAPEAAAPEVDEPAVEMAEPAPEPEPGPEMAPDAAPVADEAPEALEPEAAPEPANTPTTLPDEPAEMTPPAPEMPEIDAPDVAADAAADEAPAVEEKPTTEETGAMEDMPAQPEPDAAPVSEDMTEDTEAPASDETTGAAETPASDAMPEAAEAPARLPQIIVEGDPEPAPAPVPEAAPEIVMVSPEADLPPEVEADPAAGVITNRLPRIGDAPAEAEPVAVGPEPALSRNALAFAPAGDQPRLAFLLIDTGADDRNALGDLGNLPFPVSVAVDASATDADEAVAFYRDQGAEVVLLVPLPEGATPTDVDVTVEAYAPLLDKAVAVLAEEDLGFQTLGAGAVQLATNLAETGLGLVSYPAGLNTGHKAAVKEGVKAGLVFRDLDGEGQDGAVIRRFLDNAAFKARGEDGVIVVARTRAETLQALLEWSLGTRAQSVALAPVSAVLAGQ